MSKPTIDKCKAPGCGKPLPPYSGSGRPQEYCNGACRIAAYRARHAEGFEPDGPVDVPTPLIEDAVESVAVGKLARTDEQATRTLLEAINVLALSRRLGREARPELAWRFRKLAEVLGATIEELFGGSSD